MESTNNKSTLTPNLVIESYTAESNINSFNSTNRRHNNNQSNRSK